MSRNDITGDKQQTKVASKEYLNNYDRIFSKKEKNHDSTEPDCQTLARDECGRTPSTLELP
jgi:hypothetical protein